MFGRIFLLISLANQPISFADDRRYPNGSLYYTVLANFKDQNVTNLTHAQLTNSKMKSKTAVIA